MGLIEHKCYSANCDVCGIEFETEINGVDNCYFLSKIELEEAFYDKDWKALYGKYICNKCLQVKNKCNEKT